MSRKVLFYYCIIFLNLGISVYGGAQALEQTFIISDQPYYQIGANINYNLYLYNPEDREDKIPSQTAYVELLDENGNIIYNHKHDVRNGTSPGRFETGKIDSSGWYWIRAYTYYQIGFCDELVHYLPVYLVSLEDIREYRDRDTSFREIPDFSIFIDGGRILEDVNNTIVVRSKSLDGTGRSLDAWIIDNQNGDSITNFTINPDGTGSFLLKGGAKNDYSLIIVDENKNKKLIEFPETDPARCIARISTNPGSSMIHLSLYFDESYDQYENVEIYSRGKFSDQRLEKIKIGQKVETLAIEKENLYPGENIIYIQADGFGILGQKTIFIDERTENNLVLLKDKLIYVPRQQLSAEVRLTNPTVAEKPSWLSVLVRDTNQFKDFLTGYPATYAPQQISYKNLSYFVGIKSNEGQRSEQLLMENLIISDLSGKHKMKHTDPIHTAEQGLILKGRVVDNRNGEPLSIRALTFTQTGENPGYNFQFTNTDGNFAFEDIYFHNRNNELILNIGEDEGILLDTINIKPAFDPPQIIGNIWTNPSFLNYVIARHLDQKFSKFYTNLKDTSQTLDRDFYSKNKIYDKPDLSYDLDDYIQLKDMREVIVELLPNVKIFKLDGRTRIRIYHSANADMLPDPLFLVNGKIVKDNEYILAMDITRVKTIDVLVRESKLKYFGPVANGGVVAIYTREPVDIPFGTRIEMAGFHRPEKVIQNRMSEALISSTLPNFDPVVYWNPVLKYEKNLETMLDFYFNDLVSDMEIIIRGINKSGKLFFNRDTLTIEKPLIH